MAGKGECDTENTNNVPESLPPASGEAAPCNKQQEGRCLCREELRCRVCRKGNDARGRTLTLKAQKKYRKSLSKNPMRIATAAKAKTPSNLTHELNSSHISSSINI